MLGAAARTARHGLPKTAADSQEALEIAADSGWHGSCIVGPRDNAAKTGKGKMANPTYISLSVQSALRRQMDLIAHNMANIGTTSF